jgi:membrane protease YdiL (CAAX protease family)
MQMLLAHLLFGYIVFVTPWLGRWKYRQLKEKLAAGVTGAKLEAYRRSVLNQILRVAIVFAIAHIDPAYRETVKLLRPGYESFVATFLVAFTFTILLSAAWFRYRGNRQFEKLRKVAGAILPSTTPECSWFAAVGIGAGISEEFVFRGFLLCYLGRLVPGLRPEEALALGALIFGMNHLYQGYGGVLATTIMGALFGMLYYQSGGLLLPMVVHALVDLRIILILTPQRMLALARDITPA